MVNIKEMKNKSIWLTRKIFNKLNDPNLKKYFFECAIVQGASKKSGISESVKFCVIVLEVGAPMKITYGPKKLSSLRLF